ncbi:uncharacterized protein LOC124810017 [Hydra vulgaris]|uniref:uncharacterized protein LOC124810017 n=1 Tax=Hydra vulgaris TaxID=6087 RepID=UPI00019272C9|nr:uncharacterized protein LOC124810017 [Hydra vulgaris]
MGTDILLNHLIRKNFDQVQDVLDAYDDINVLYREGFFFGRALSKNKVKIFEALMAYFENKQFPIKNEIYKDEKKKLTNILEDFACEIELSSKMKKILSKYIDFDFSSIDSSENDFNNEPVSYDVGMHNDLGSTFPAGNETDISSKSTNFELTPGNCSSFCDSYNIKANVEKWLSHTP